MKIHRAISLVIFLFVLLTSCSSKPAGNQESETKDEVQTEDSWAPSISYLSLLTVDYAPGKWYNVNLDEILLDVALGTKKPPSITQEEDYALLDVYELPENFDYDYENLSPKDPGDELNLIHSFRIDSYRDYPDPSSQYNSDKGEWEHTLPLDVGLSFFGSELCENYGRLIITLRVFTREDELIISYNSFETIHFIKEKDYITFLHPDEYIKYKINIYGRG